MGELQLPTIEEYYDRWKKENYESLCEDRRRQIYNQYIIKQQVLHRDMFTCQNLNCNSDDSPLTVHHIKWQKNGGEWKLRNCITICQACHKGFNRGRIRLQFPQRDELPRHVAGHTFQHTIPSSLGPTSVERRKQARELRKKYKEYWGTRISWERVCVLLRWLETYKASVA